MTKSNFCVIGAARSRTTLIADVLCQAYPDYAYIHEPGLLNKENSVHLEYAYAKLKSENEINSFTHALINSEGMIGKIVSGATFLELSVEDLFRISRNSTVIVTTRDFADSAISYVAAMKTRRFFAHKGQEPETSISYEPSTDRNLLFWYTVYYSQADRWIRLLKTLTLKANLIEIKYEDAVSYKAIGDLLGIEHDWIEKVKPPYSKPYTEVFSNYTDLLQDVMTFKNSLDLI
jgi:hypothetical protein